MDGSDLSLQAKAEDINAVVTGFLIPIFRTDPETGRKLAGLDEESFLKVAQGYACANADCLAEFRTYTIICPVCGYTRDIHKDLVPAPHEWSQHLQDRDDGYAAPIPRNVFSPDEFIRSVREDSEIEQHRL